MEPEAGRRLAHAGTESTKLVRRCLPSRCPLAPTDDHHAVREDMAAGCLTDSPSLSSPTPFLRKTRSRCVAARCSVDYKGIVRDDRVRTAEARGEYVRVGFEW